MDLMLFIIGIASLLVLIVLCVYIRHAHKHNESFTEHSSSTQFRFDVVIARYAEDLEWLCDDEIVKLFKSSHVHIHIYNKNPNIPLSSRTSNCLKKFSSTMHVLQNVGRDAHTYLTHIVSNYEQLADVTVFLPGSCDSCYKTSRCRETLITAITTKKSCFIVKKTDHYSEQALLKFTIDSYKSTHPSNASVNPEEELEQSPIRPLGSWYKHVFKEEPSIKYVAWNYIFAVSKEHVHNTPLDAYKEALSYLKNHSNHEVVHYLERCWISIFGPLPDDVLYIRENYYRSAECINECIPFLDSNKPFYCGT